MIRRALLRGLPLKPTRCPSTPTTTAVLLNQPTHHSRRDEPGHGVLRGYHSTPPAQNMMLVAAGASVAAAALFARYILSAVDTKQRVDELTNPDTGADDKAATKSTHGEPASKAPKPSAAPSSTGGYFSAQSMARRFYRGGFEDKMTRREAALILGVR